MGRVFVLVLILSLSAGGWELTIAFTGDLHVSLGRLSAIAPLLAEADLILDAGDTWEDLYRLTGLPQAREMARRMGELGYAAMVLGNHELYLGPALREVIATAPFPVLATNLAGDLPTLAFRAGVGNGVPIVEAGHRAGAVGLVTLSETSFSYRLVRSERLAPLPSFLLPALAALAFLLR